jgi:biopolymer transport protein ExbB
LNACLSTARFGTTCQKGTTLRIKTLFNRAEQRLAILGTLANAAPFVGLLGTVIGIIRAFHTISQASGSGGGMTLVAGGISEALVSTAAGLAVAIPASMLFNYFTFKNEKLMETAGID